jgi:hypothetical protein
MSTSCRAWISYIWGLMRLSFTGVFLLRNEVNKQSIALRSIKYANRKQILCITITHFKASNMWNWSISEVLSFFSWFRVCLPYLLHRFHVGMVWDEFGGETHATSFTFLSIIFVSTIWFLWYNTCHYLMPCSSDVVHKGGKSLHCKFLALRLLGKMTLVGDLTLEIPSIGLGVLKC